MPTCGKHDLGLDLTGSITSAPSWSWESRRPAGAPLAVATALTSDLNGAGHETVMLRKYVLEASELRALRAAVPIVWDGALTAGDLYRFHLVVQVAKRSARDDGLQRNAMLAAFGALKDLDCVPKLVLDSHHQGAGL